MNIVTKRFLTCYEQLKNDNRVRSGRQFALSLDYLPQSFSEIVNGRREVTVDLLRKAVEKYKFNPHYLLSGENPMFLYEHAPHTVRTLTVVVDPSSESAVIPHVPLYAQQDYISKAADPDFMKSLPVISLPDARLRSLTLRAFDVYGDNMEPTILEGDKVLASFVHPADWESSLTDYSVCVVVTPAGILVRRVVNKLREKKCMELWSDNHVYDPFSAPVQELREIWQVQQRISSFMPHPAHRRTPLSEDILNIKHHIQQWAPIMEQLAEQLAALPRNP